MDKKVTLAAVNFLVFFYVCADNIVVFTIGLLETNPLKQHFQIWITFKN